MPIIDIYRTRTGKRVAVETGYGERLPEALRPYEFLMTSDLNDGRPRISIGTLQLNKDLAGQGYYVLPDTAPLPPSIVQAGFAAGQFFNDHGHLPVEARFIYADGAALPKADNLEIVLADAVKLGNNLSHIEWIQIDPDTPWRIGRENCAWLLEWFREFVFHVEVEASSD